MPIHGTSLSRRITAALVLVALTAAAGVFCSTPACVLADDSQAADATDAIVADNPSEISRKAEILNSPSWRRAVFELRHWLDNQQIYTASQVAAIKSDFNARVAKMSSFELQYLLDDLEAKFQVMDTPEARDARTWVAQYLSAASDSKRAELLKDIPDVTRMSAGELADELGKIEAKKQQLAKQHSAFEQSRREIVASQQQAIAATQRAISSANRSAGFSYSPYRGGQGSDGKTPFSDVHIGARSISASLWGASVAF